MGAKPFAISSTAHTWELLERGRIDVFATSGIHEIELLGHLPDREGNSQENIGRALWTTVAFFHLLHPKHADKVQKLNDALRDMIINHDSAISLDIPGIQPARLAH